MKSNQYINTEKRFYSIDLSKVLAQHREEIPMTIILDSCDNNICNPEGKPVGDGEIFIINFVENVEIFGEIHGSGEHGKKFSKFKLGTKQKCSCFGWQYAENNEIFLSFSVKLLSGEYIPVVEDEKIPFPTRSKLFIFYS